MSDLLKKLSVSPVILNKDICVGVLDTILSIFYGMGTEQLTLMSAPDMLYIFNRRKTQFFLIFKKEI